MLSLIGAFTLVALACAAISFAVMWAWLNHADARKKDFYLRLYGGLSADAVSAPVTVQPPPLPLFVGQVANAPD